MAAQRQRPPPAAEARGLLLGQWPAGCKGSFQSRRSRWVPQPFFRVRGKKPAYRLVRGSCQGLLCLGCLVCGLFSPFLLTSADTFPPVPAWPRARSTLLEPSVSWWVRTQPSLSPRNATGWMLTPAPGAAAEPGRCWRHSCRQSRCRRRQNQKLTLDTGTGWWCRPRW